MRSHPWHHAPQMHSSEGARARAPRRGGLGALCSHRLSTLRKVGTEEAVSFCKGVKMYGCGLSPRKRSARAKCWAREQVCFAAAPPAAPHPLRDGGNEGLCSLGTRQSESATAV